MNHGKILLGPNGESTLQANHVFDACGLKDTHADGKVDPAYAAIVGQFAYVVGVRSMVTASRRLRPLEFD